MPSPTTYSFNDVQVALSGPGVVASLGADSGASEEGITVEPTEEIDNMKIGAGGAGMHSLIVDKSGKITVRLLKTSPDNAVLAGALAFQRTSGANWGQNTISIVNTSTGDTITAQACAFSKVPTITYAKEGGMNEWEFKSLNIDVGLGAGVG